MMSNSNLSASIIVGTLACCVLASAANAVPFRTSDDLSSLFGKSRSERFEPTPVGPLPELFHSPFESSSLFGKKGGHGSMQMGSRVVYDWSGSDAPDFSSSGGRGNDRSGE